jgi:hypothetical protein
MDVSSLYRRAVIHQTLARIGYRVVPGIGQIIIGIDTDLIHEWYSPPVKVRTFLGAASSDFRLLIPLCREDQVTGDDDARIPRYMVHSKQT